MDKLEAMQDRKYLFGSIHIVANKKETLIERELRDYDVTFKQWFLLSVLENAFDHAPSLNEAARAMGSSHQNVKKIAVILARKGYLEMVRDNKDSRITRLRLTRASGELAEAIRDRAARFTQALFAGIGDEELSKARGVIQKMTANLAAMERGEQEED